MPTAFNKIVDGFTFQTIPPIVGTPTYNTIAEVNLKLNSVIYPLTDAETIDSHPSRLSSDHRNH